MHRIAHAAAVATRIDATVAAQGFACKIYEALDVFALSSHYEGLPYVLLEAMAMALPVVATRVTGCLDVITHDETGLLVAPDRPSDLADGILQLLRNPQDAQRRGANAREAVERNFSLEKFLSRTARLYTDLAG